ncbi:hypothetical protein [Streptomyces roseoviridis]|uniref:Uncharacterized protein n=1 Tax=Streptomyces roseoviridis TaxID=67361 RepID=A0ABV5QYG8_9ACTN
MTCEVTCASPAGRPDRRTRGYARAGTPVRLLIDREAAGEAVVRSGPDGGGDARNSAHEAGTRVPLPGPLGSGPGTSEF